jgi:hypothetical protein
LRLGGFCDRDRRNRLNLRRGGLACGRGRNRGGHDEIAGILADGARQARRFGRLRRDG